MTHWYGLIYQEKVLHVWMDCLIEATYCNVNIIAKDV